MTTRVCMVGYGAIAGFHAKILQAEGVAIDTVVGRRPDETARFAGQFGARRHTTDLDVALAEGDFDAVVVASPNAVHAGQTRRALLAGKHVLSELPLAMSYSEAAELVELAERQGRVLMVCHTSRFLPGLAEVRRRVEEGSLHLLHVVGHVFMHRIVDVGWTGRQRSWTDSAIWHHGGHVVDCCLWLLGVTSPSQLSVQCNVAPPDPRTGTTLDFDVSVRTTTGQLASASLSYNARLGGTEYLIVGEEDTFRYCEGLLVGPEGVLMELEPRENGDEGLGWEFQDREFLAAIREGRAPASSGADVLPHLAVLQQVQDELDSISGT